MTPGFSYSPDLKGNREDMMEMLNLFVSRSRAILSAEWKFSKSGRVREQSFTKASGERRVSAGRGRRGEIPQQSRQ